MSQERNMQTTSTMLHAAKDGFRNFTGEPFRKYQEEAIRFILESEKRFVILEAPTGSGKSLIAMVSGMAMGGMTYMVHSKMLQNQITESFPEAKSLFGRSNYQCMNKDGLTCAECTHTKRYPCQHKRTNCQYASEKKLLLAAKLKILNYDYYLSEVNYVGRLDSQPFIVIDEADNLENTLINFMTLIFTKYAMGRLGIGMPERKTADSKLGIRPWVNFAEMAKYRAMGIIKKLGGEIEDFGEITQDYQVSKIKEYERLNGLLAKIALFLDNVDDSWMYQEAENGGISFRPLWVSEKMAERFMWGHGAVPCKWVLMSASLLPASILAKTLGIPSDEIDYLCVKSTFPVENRQIYVNPVANLTAKTMDIETPKLIDEISKILAKHPNEKGVIHSVSFKLAQKVYDGVNNPRLLIHDSKNRQEVLDEFLASKSNAVIISPSMDRGISLDMDLARFQIICKMPYLSLGDKITSTRVYGGGVGNTWYQATAMLSVLQMCGRACRSEDDFSVCYVLDEQFKKVLLKSPRLLPFWFRDAIEFVYNEAEVA
jgi:ATP-dependent DNA helicase DinG